VTCKGSHSPSSHTEPTHPPTALTADTNLLPELFSAVHSGTSDGVVHIFSVFVCMAPKTGGACLDPQSLVLGFLGDLGAQN
jgi:hypothetical protein